MTLEDIHKTTQDFADAAKRAKSIGIDAIKIHMAHGIYYINFFLHFLIIDQINMDAH